jgi:DNA-binding NarL/FixJ family response regulator
MANDTTQHPVRVFIVDDDSRVRRGLRALLDSHTALEVIGEAGDAAQAKAMVSGHNPDVVLVDVLLPDADTGLGLVEELSATAHVLAMSVRGGFGDAAIAAGARVFVEKGASPEELVAAVHQAAARA